MEMPQTLEIVKVLEPVNVHPVRCRKCERPYCLAFCQIGGDLHLFLGCIDCDTGAFYTASPPMEIDGL